MHHTTAAALERDGSEFRNHEPLPLPEASPAASLRSWRVWYDDLIEFYMARPGADATEAAAHVGRSPTWVRLIVRSDSFQTALAAARDARMNNTNKAIADKLQAVALESLDVLLDKMSKHRTNIPIEKVTATTDMVLERLGYGVKPPEPVSQTNVQINVGADPAAIAAARQSLRDAEAARLINGGTPSAPHSAQPAATEAGEQKQIELARSDFAPVEPVEDSDF